MYLNKYNADRKLKNLQKELVRLNSVNKRDEKWTDQFNTWKATVATTLELALPESKSFLKAFEEFCKKYKDRPQSESEDVSNIRAQEKHQVEAVTALLSKARDIIISRRDEKVSEEFENAVFSAVTRSVIPN